MNKIGIWIEVVTQTEAMHKLIFVLWKFYSFVEINIMIFIVRILLFEMFEKDFLKIKMSAHSSQMHPEAVKERTKTFFWWFNFSSSSSLQMVKRVKHFNSPQRSHFFSISTKGAKKKSHTFYSARGAEGAATTDRQTVF